MKAVSAFVCLSDSMFSPAYPKLNITYHLLAQALSVSVENRSCMQKLRGMAAFGYLKYGTSWVGLRSVVLGLVP